MQLAIVADPHVSLLDQPHYGLELGHTRQATAAIIADLNARQPDAVIWLGDLTHENTDDARASFAQLRATLAVSNLAITGNHDVQLITKHAFAQVTPIVRCQSWFAAGWSVAVIDTVRELAPDDASGWIDEPTFAFLRGVATDAAHRGCPLLVLGHQQPMPESMRDDRFWEAVGGSSVRGVYLGGHSHVDRVRQPTAKVAGRWDVVEIASCCMLPISYRLLTLSPTDLTVSRVLVAVDGLPAGDSASRASADPVVLRV